MLYTKTESSRMLKIAVHLTLRRKQGFRNIESLDY